MSAYVVLTPETALDNLELGAYLKEVRGTLAGHEFRVLAFNGSHEDLEGPSKEGTVILEFPSVEAAKTWYNDWPYREVSEHRLKGVTYRGTLVEGVSSQPAQLRHWVEFVGAV
jgi:uncharacterized protein (DUF1330 family)